MSDQNRIVLFVCVHNAGRSQMASAFFNRNVPSDTNFVGDSAGTEPADHVHPEVVTAMLELSPPIDLSDKTPQLLSTEMLDRCFRVVLMGCIDEEACPLLFVDRSKLVEWNLENPKGKPIERVREIREEVEKHIVQLVQDLVQ